MKARILSLFLGASIAACGGGGGNDAPADNTGNGILGGTTTTTTSTASTSSTSITTVNTSTTTSVAGLNTPTTDTSTTTVASTTTTTAGASLAANYTLSDVGSAGPYASIGARVAGINANGQVLAGAANSPYDKQSFLYTNGTTVNITRQGYAVGPLTLTDGGDALVNTYVPCRYCEVVYEPYLYRNGQLSPMTLDFTAVAMNNDGQIVGTKVFSGRTYVTGALFSNGTLTDMGTTTEGASTHPVAINQKGQVVGDIWMPSNGSHAFLYSDGKMIDLGTYSADYLSSNAVAINDLGQVVGTLLYKDGIRRDVFLYSDGKMSIIGPGGAGGINNNGQIIGSDANNLAFLYSNGKLISLNDLPEVKAAGWVLDGFNTRINDRGQITGIGTVNGAMRVYLLSPSP